MKIQWLTCIATVHNAVGMHIVKSISCINMVYILRVLLYIMQAETVSVCVNNVPVLSVPWYRNRQFSSDANPVVRAVCGIYVCPVCPVCPVCSVRLCLCRLLGYGTVRIPFHQGNGYQAMQCVSVADVNVSAVLWLSHLHQRAKNGSGFRLSRWVRPVVETVSCTGVSGFRMAGIRLYRFCLGHEAYVTGVVMHTVAVHLNVLPYHTVLNCVSVRCVRCFFVKFPSVSVYPYAVCTALPPYRRVTVLPVRKSVCRAFRKSCRLSVQGSFVSSGNRFRLYGNVRRIRFGGAVTRHRGGGTGRR